MRTISSTRDVAPGASAPLGATVLPGGVNFSVFSKHAVLLELLLFDDENATQPARIIPLPADQHRTYHYWHAFVPGLQPGQVYAYRAHGTFDPDRGLWFERPVRTVGIHLARLDRKSTRLNSSHMSISYAVFCLKKKKT